MSTPTPTDQERPSGFLHSLARMFTDPNPYSTFDVQSGVGAAANAVQRSEFSPTGMLSDLVDYNHPWPEGASAGIMPGTGQTRPDMMPEGHLYNLLSTLMAKRKKLLAFQSDTGPLFAPTAPMNRLDSPLTPVKQAYEGSDGDYDLNDYSNPDARTKAIFSPGIKAPYQLSRMMDMDYLSQMFQR